MYSKKKKITIKNTEEEDTYLRATALPAHCGASSLRANTGLALFPSDCPELVRSDRSHIRERTGIFPHSGGTRLIGQFFLLLLCC
jgi:hypothetical protein